MRAIIVHAFGGPEVLGLENVPDPAAGPGEVVVAVRAAGVNPVEAYVRAGTYGPRAFPFTPGTDAAGVVEAVGRGVLTPPVGARVYVFGAAKGTYAERVVVPATHARLLPASMSFEQGAAVGVPYATAYRALFVRGNAEPAETVLIHGASGGVGLAATQLAVARGCLVIGTAGTDAGLELVRRQGAAFALNHKSPTHLDELSTITAGRGVDLVVEMLANVNLDRDLGAVAKGGRVVVVGNRGRVEIDPRQMMQRDSDVRGMSLMHADEAELKRIHAALGAGFANGSLVPVVGDTFPLADAAKAHEDVMGEGATGKVVLLT